MIYSNNDIIWHEGVPKKVGYYSEKMGAYRVETIPTTIYSLTTHQSWALIKDIRPYKQYFQYWKQINAQI